MKVTAFIRQATVKGTPNETVHIYFRVRDGKTDIKAASELSINPNHWNAEKQGYKSRVSLVSESVKVDFEKKISELKTLISEKYYRGADGEWLKTLIEEYHHPDINKRISKNKENLLQNRIRQYAENRPLTPRAKLRLLGIAKKVDRYTEYMKTIMKRRNFGLNVDTMTSDDLRSLQAFICKEVDFYDEYPELYTDIEKEYAPREQSENSLNTIFRRIHTVTNYCLKNKLTTNDPFATFETPKVIYGPPFYLNLEERDKVYYADLSECCRGMQVYRDIFMFQCLIGCRAGDLLTLRKDNIVDGSVEYIAEKTKGHNPRTIRVPLNDKAKAILEKYNDLGDRILPKFNYSDYNKNIRKILKHVGINRKVVVINLMTRESEMKPLCDVATTHTARKTFIGNLYKKVKDPSLVASLSGHTDGSRAFARYREIDMEMKRELVEMID